MTSGIVFVLHGPADEKFAGELAAALAPLPALPVQLTQSERGVQVGGGAAAVVVWTQDLCAPAMTRAVLAAVADSSASVALCKGAVPPDALRARVIACLPARADAIADAEQLRGVIAAAAQPMESDLRGVTPAIGRESGAVKGGRQGMAARSAYGLIATLAVAGVAAPMISERAAATNVPAPEATPTSATTTAAAAAPADVDEAAVVAAAPSHVEEAHVSAAAVAPAEATPVVAASTAPAETPAFDQWVLSTTAPAIADAAPVEVSAVAAETPAPDPKRETFAARLAASEGGLSAAKPRAPALASAHKPVHLAGHGDAGSGPGE